MRKLFASAFGVAAIGATLFGAVYAWSTTVFDSNSATVGIVSVSAVITPNAAFLGPDNGVPVTVGTVAVTNTGTLLATAFTGSVTITSLVPTAPTSAPACATTDFTPSLLAGAVPGSDTIDIATNVGAPNDCQGDGVNYTVNITATT